MNFPTKCPYCNKDIVENRTQLLFEQPNGKGLLLESHRCIHCKQYFFIVKDQLCYPNGEVYALKTCFCYPIPNSAIDFPQRIETLSPNAFTAYQQTIKAQNNGYNMLVGAGLRIALEWLVWDYLIKVKHFSEEELKPLSLANRIAKMDSNFYTNICTKLIRLFGNDSVHIIKMLDFSADEVIEIFNILCTLIDNELSILEANERLNSSKPNAD